MFPIFAGNSASTGYNLTRSLRFRASASAYLNRTPAAAGNRQTWTWSAWVKRGTLGTAQSLFENENGASTNGHFNVFINSDNTINFSDTDNGATSTYNFTTTQVFRDPSAWYHLVFVLDTTNATSTNRVKMYVNGVQVTTFSAAAYPVQNYSGSMNRATATYISSLYYTAGGFYFDGYLTEVNFIDGQALTPTSFGSTNALTGVWQPARYTGTYGTNGFYLPFTDNSALTTSSNVGLGKDFSGNGNYWVTNNISITAGVTYDSMTDVPTLTSATAANFAVVNPLDAAVGTASNGNLSWTCGASNGNFRGSIAIPASGQFYFEGTVLTTTSASVSISFGVAASTASLTTQGAQSTLYQLFAASTGVVSINGSNVGTLGTFSAGDVLQVAVDVTNSKLWLGKNNVFYDSSGGTTGNPSTGANPVTTNSVVGSFAFGSCYQDTLNANFGQRPFSYTPPTGFVALNTYNLPTSTIVKGNTVMDATLWTGNGTSQTITNAAGFKPDLIWNKMRSGAYYNILTDSVRGTNSQLFSNDTLAQETRTDRITAINSNGFSVGSYADVNANTQTFVGWQWQAGQGSTSSNTNGSITSTVSVNASAGFSVVTYTGNGTVGATIGHGLGVAPSWIIVKSRSAVTSWGVYHSSLGNTGGLYLNDTNAFTVSNQFWNNTSPTSSVFSANSNNINNANATTYVAYCWTPIAGFSAFGSYTGNGSTDGPFVYTGFRPKFLLFKRSDATYNWWILDSSRDTYNIVGNYLYPNLSSAEGNYASTDGIDFVSNGFKIRNTSAGVNASGGVVIYAAFAENPFKNSLAR